MYLMRWNDYLFYIDKNIIFSFAIYINFQWVIITIIRFKVLHHPVNEDLKQSQCSNYLVFHVQLILLYEKHKTTVKERTKQGERETASSG